MLLEKIHQREAVASKKAIEDFPAGGVERLGVADEEADAATVQNEERGNGQAAVVICVFAASVRNGTFLAQGGNDVAGRCEFRGQRVASA